MKRKAFLMITFAASCLACQAQLAEMMMQAAFQGSLESATPAAGLVMAVMDEDKGDKAALENYIIQTKDRIARKDYARPLTLSQRQQLEEDVRRLMIEQAQRLGGKNYAITRQTEAWERISRFSSLTDVNGYANYLVKQGLANNAQAVQISGLINDKITKYNQLQFHAKDSLDLHTTVVGAIYLSKGYDAAVRYVNETIADKNVGKPLCKQMKKVAKNMDKYREELADPNKARQVMINYFDTNPRSSTRKALRKCFLI